MLFKAKIIIAYKLFNNNIVIIFKKKLFKKFNKSK